MLHVLRKAKKNIIMSHCQHPDKKIWCATDTSAGIILCLMRVSSKWVHDSISNAIKKSHQRTVTFYEGQHKVGRISEWEDATRPSSHWVYFEDTTRQIFQRRMKLELAPGDNWPRFLSRDLESLYWKYFTRLTRSEKVCWWLYTITICLHDQCKYHQCKVYWWLR